MDISSTALRFSLGSGDEEHKRAPEADPQDGQRGTFRGAGPYTVTMATEHWLEDIRQVVVHCLRVTPEIHGSFR